MFFPNGFYNNYHRIVQAPGYVVIVSESMNAPRVIPLDPSTGSGVSRARSRDDRRPHVGANVRSWLGDSRGWWEGNTLVVETTNITDERRFQGSTKDVRLVERFTRDDVAKMIAGDFVHPETGVRMSLPMRSSIAFYLIETWLGGFAR